jgi:hypothetical protein
VNLLGLHRRHRGGLPQLSLAFLVLTREQMTFEALVAFNFPAPGNFEPLHRSAIAFNFWHIRLLVIFFLFGFGYGCRPGACLPSACQGAGRSPGDRQANAAKFGSILCFATFAGDPPRLICRPASLALE